MRDPQHILMTADTVGGVWTYSIELSRSLAARGVRVSLATMGALPSAGQREQAARVKNLEIFESSYKLEWMIEPWGDVDRAGQWLLALERELQPDMVHVNGFVHGALDWTSPSIVVGHSCVVSWWNAVRRSTVPPEWDEYRRRVRDGLQRANAIVAVSRFIASELARHYGPLPHISTIYDGSSSTEYHPACKEQFVLSCGRVWDDAKNISALDRAAASIAWPVYAAGEDQHPEGGKAALKYLHPIGLITPEGMRSWYGRAAIYALPARYEPFGLSALEAALSGCALVLGDNPSLLEIWHDAAIFVQPDDHEALAAAINTLISDPHLRDTFAHRARTRALAFTPERMVRGYLDIYSHACAMHAAPAAGLSCVS
jgi:glycogen synthase